MDIETKIELVKRKPTEEVVSEQALREMFENYKNPKHYIGFEISGLVHLGTGLCTGIKIKDFLKAGIKPTVWLADYHTWLNGKLGGDIGQIRKVAEGYFKHCFVSLGLDEEKVSYKLASKEYNQDYWADVIRISNATTLKRMMRCVTIMGRKESENLYSSAVVYPAMQAADIFLLDVQIAHSGMDQRKVHMLAHELAPKFNRKFVSVHGHLLPGLQGPARMNAPNVQTGVQESHEAQIEAATDAKMSKSKPGSAIFIHDSEDEIKKKISKAFCPEKISEGNPIFEMAEYLILRDKPLKIERPAKFGGDLEIEDGEELGKIYMEGKLHPVDLKNAVSRELISMLKPSRDYFAKNKEYLEQIKAVEITR